MSALIVGGMGGIGRAILEALLARPSPSSVHATWHQKAPEFEHPNLTWHQLDICNEESLRLLSLKIPKLRYLINAVGILHHYQQFPEKALSRLEADYLMQNFQINTLPTMLLAKHFATQLKGMDTAVFATISAKVGSIEDNHLGGWYSYRMSKAALNMGLKTISIEWHRTHKNVCVAAIHPGTTDTDLSKPYQRGVPSTKLFSPDKSAKYILDIIEGLTPNNTGKFWSWDGSNLPW